MKDLLNGTRRALLVQPEFSRRSFWNCTEVCRLIGARYLAAPLGLITVAALLPRHWQLRLVDENVRPLTAADIEWADIVLTGGMLPQQAAILDLIERAHAAGKPVVLGGPDPSEQPQIYDQADYLVMGEGEVTVPLFLEDLARGALSGIYRSSERADMTRAVAPRYDLIRFRDYINVGVQFSRGCPFNCEFCDIIELFGRRPRTKTPAQVLTELQALHDLGYRGHVDLVDDNLIGNRSKALDVLAAIAAWSKQHKYPFYFGIEASINLARDQELLQLMRECDIRFAFVGIESPDNAVLLQTQKTQNLNVVVPEAVRALAAHGLIVIGGFILGLDGEPPDIARRAIDLIEDAGICLAMVGTLYALPQTQLSRRLQQEGRLFHRKAIDPLLDIDQTTSGLNFVTSRPRAEILEDQARVLRHIYDPARYYRKILLTALSLRPSGKHRPGFREALKLGRDFLRVSGKVGLDRQTGRLYWGLLVRVLFRNPAALPMAATLSALYVHFSKQSGYLINLLDAEAEHVRSMGEDKYNEMMIAGTPPLKSG